MVAEKSSVRGYPVRANEHERLQEVLKYQFADGGANSALNRICQLAQRLFGVPITLVTLLSEDEQTFIAKCGIDLDRTARADAICNWTIERDDVLAVPDTRADPRFADNPYVTGETGLRFYAGAPLSLRPGLALGSLCLLDTQPREFSPENCQTLAALAALATNELQRLRTIIDLKWQTRILSQATRLSKVGSWAFDPATKRMTWSAEMYRIHELDPAVTPTIALSEAFWEEDEREQIRTALGDLIRQGKQFDREIAITTASGRKRWIRCLGEAEQIDGTIERILGCVQDITEEHDYQDNLERIAFRDRLTGLSNRSHFLERLAGATSRCDTEDRQMGIVILSLDDFKNFNETLGHDAGDRLLQAMGARLAEAARPQDLVARLGDDEFGLILPDIEGPEELRAIGAGLLERLRPAFEIDARSFSVTAGAGAAVYPGDERDADGLMRAASLALMRAKRAGRNQMAMFEPSMKVEVESRAQLLEDVRAGISAGQFHLYYQPIVSLNQPHRVSKFEALIRWEHPTRGTLSPAAFATALDDSTTSLLLADIVLDQAVKQARLWLDAGVEFGAIGINLAPAQFRAVNLPETILSRLAASEVAPRHLVAEVTENIYLGPGSEDVADTLRTLHQAGIRIALDDFGTGFASLSHLRDFPIDRLKIDKSFVQNPENDAIVRAVVMLGSGLGMKVVAEGVEDTDQIARLCEMGCDEAQGYYFSRPMPAREVPSFLDAFNGRGLAGAQGARNLAGFGLADPDDAPSILSAQVRYR
ncbi:bifunctional diguanylate cyclase/phosphodiesterase [Afifella sp. IM 167]|uniref:putative bifunctional diguanylate cyclase/phosphodiesterase n=1 Tax=Afifella sp. IM 167 TaxID=2033586 RepID=UPI001CCD683E|nr:EAL domain-containing protein [Afifella sp. IM 167]MBZ8132191.1 hypothetical protein [Afifella sp. IM 167]